MTTTPVDVLVPAASVPEAVPSETNDGAFESDAVQFKAVPPVFAMLTGCVVTPSVPCVPAVPALAASDPGADTVTVIPTVCGLPAIVAPPLTPASVIEPPYEPAFSPVPMTVAANVAVPPLNTVATVGVTVNQPVPLPSVTVGATVTFPVHTPLTANEKVCAAGFFPATVVNASVATEGACSVQACCTVKATDTTTGTPTA